MTGNAYISRTLIDRALKFTGQVDTGTVGGLGYLKMFGDIVNWVLIGQLTPN